MFKKKIYADLADEVLKSMEKQMMEDDCLPVVRIDDEGGVHTTIYDSSSPVIYRKDIDDLWYSLTVDEEHGPDWLEVKNAEDVGDVVEDIVLFMCGTLDKDKFVPTMRKLINANVAVWSTNDETYYAAIF